MEFRQPLPPIEITGINGQKILYFTGQDFGFHNAFKSFFTLLGRNFCTAEHYLAWQKARYFGDQEIAEKILTETNTHKIRRWAQRVRNFSAMQWGDIRDRVFSN